MGPERNKKNSSAGSGNNPNVRQPYNPMGAHHHLQVSIFPYFIRGPAQDYKFSNNKIEDTPILKQLAMVKRLKKVKKFVKRFLKQFVKKFVKKIQQKISSKNIVKKKSSERNLSKKFVKTISQKEFEGRNGGISRPLHFSPSFSGQKIVFSDTDFTLRVKNDG